ncbi:Hypothetical protein SRAE_2000126200 [Strongyloides ratti]|uniref:DUF7381 domain-containing protein n=1 Tax=Strongyloides ratti TaxID=34506 RepID=A0A090MY55_STRRB|nr:Hypothetical protein SRAE_2000126200 [Strongyloides ratti]CEF66594.1 Hypothetical protein SRAE_2000126200 [Strongyloides ratti]
MNISTVTQVDMNSEEKYLKIKNFIRRVTLDFPEVPYENILLKREFKTSENIVNDIHTNNRYLHVQINGVSRYIALSSYHVVIEFVMHHGKKYFICNRSPFKTYKEARIFCELLEEFSQFKLQHIFLGKNPLASKIWRNT